MDGNEKELINKSKNGNIEAFEELIEAYQKKVFNLAFRIIGNFDDANELAQEALIRIYKSIRSFKEESSFSTWVYKITTNICLDEIRKRKNKKVVYIDDEIKLTDGEVIRQIEDDKPTPEEKAESNEIKKTVFEAIGKLPEDHKVVIILRDIQGFSYEEIARITKCPEGTIKSRLNRARLTLREILKKKKELFSEYYVK